MHRKTLVIAAVVMSSCGPGGDPGSEGLDLAAVQSAIVGGVSDSADPAVVAIAVSEQGGYAQFCSGTLVGSKTVLTAAHCINAYGAQYSYAVLFGPLSWSPTSSIKVISQTKNPNYNGGNYDFGVLQLEKPATVQPIGLNDTPLSAGDIGRAIRHVGFGVTDAAGNGGGRKREVTFDIREVKAATIESGAAGKQTCGGDSGGPGLVITAGSTVERVAGVVSYGDQDCAQYGVDGRVDFGLSWIKSTMNQWEAPTCAQDGKCLAGCTPIDQDCACATDGRCTADCAVPSQDADCPKDCGATGVCSQQACPVPDPDCVDVGKVCQSAYSCVSRDCVTDPQNRIPYCTQACTADTDCPSLMACDTAGRVCLFRPRPEKQLYDECSQADFCAASICTGPSGASTLRCVRPCASQVDCGSAGTCEGDASGQRFCHPPVELARFDTIKVPRAVTEGQAATNAGCTAAPGAFFPLAALLLALRRRRN